MRPLRRAQAVLAAGAALTLGGCGSSSTPAPASSPPPVVVPGPPAAYSAVAISAGARRVSLTEDQWSAIAPLRAARSFVPPEALSAYGLDPPTARIVYQLRTGTQLTLDVGNAGFDAHFLYVMVTGGRSVYTVASAQLRPLLADVGVAVPVPTT